jgi:hypothetical protein
MSETINQCLALMIRLQTHQRPVKNTARVQWSYHKKLGFVDPLVSVGVEHIECNSETSFRLCNKINYRKRAALRSILTNAFLHRVICIFNQTLNLSQEMQAYIYIYIHVYSVLQNAIARITHLEKVLEVSRDKYRQFSRFVITKNRTIKFSIKQRGFHAVAIFSRR